MRALGRKGGKGRNGVKPEQVPASLREELRKLDPAIVRGAIEQALAGGNESARVSAVKLLADIDAFRKDGDCPRCARLDDGAMKAAADKFMAAMELQITSVVRSEDGPEHTDRLRTEENDSQVTAMIRRAVRRAHEGREDELQAAVVQVLEKIQERLQHAGTVVENDVASERAEAIFAQLEEHGLLVRRDKVEERAEQLAQERLAALKAEHSLTV